MFYQLEFCCAHGVDHGAFIEERFDSYSFSLCSLERDVLHERLAFTVGLLIVRRVQFNNVILFTRLGLHSDIFCMTWILDGGVMLVLVCLLLARKD